MLKRKLIRTGLLLNVTLLLIAVTTTSGIRHPLVLKRPQADSSMQWLRFDAESRKLVPVADLGTLEASSILLNKKGLTYVNDYMRRNEELFQLVKKRGVRFFPVMDKVFRKYNLPVELKYLAVVESELNANARSKVGARGPWQLMPVTARLLSLKVTTNYDERTHVQKSTVAAALYLRDLYNQFGDWLLVIAAYNSGPVKVQQAIKKSRSRNFWKLQHFLPAETRGHVKKFISTHYYFEGQGSATTLGFEESQHYERMTAFLAMQDSLQTANTVIVDEPFECN